MAINFNQINELLRQDFTIENSKELANHILLLMGINTPNHIYTQNSLRKITDTTKKSMFVDDPQFADFKAAYDITSSHYDVNIKHKQLILPRLFVIKQYSRSNIIWLNKLGINYEDEPLLNGFYPLGLDFVACQNRFLVVVSNQDNLRVLELNQGEELNSTQIEILSNWQNLFAEETNKKLLHGKLWDSLNLESVNKKFYIDIIQSFANLKQHLIENKQFDNNQAVIFTNRLIGRLLFCYFLIKKGVIPAGYLELDQQNDNDYYHNKLSQLFFAVLNTPINERSHDDRSTPYLNGGLFERKDTDIDNVTFPNNYFNNLFAIFRKYNWTVDESLSNYEVMAIDPEMLGRIFENLLAEINVDNDGSSESARKAKGAFYTPRVIVDYMCKESLRQYLQTNSQEHSYTIINRLLDDSIGYLTDQKKNWTDDIKPYKEHLVNLLDKITVFDPACGSGAFPMGMLQLILHTYERLGDKLKPNHRKIKIIENSIFGADIEPNAIEIARLRAWLSIIVDEDKQAIEPLPNLDFKFVCCNSLIKLERQGQSNLADNIGTVEKLQELQHTYFRARAYKTKQDIRQNYHDLIEQSRSQNSLFGKSEYLEQIESYHPFDTKNICQFYDNQFMFGIQDGFDVVIGNPPYIKEYTNKDSFTKLKDSTYYQGKMDLWYFFACIGLDILKQNGCQCFIAPNNWTTNTGASIMRNKLIQESVIHNLIDFGNFKVFESASIQTMIYLLSKNNQPQNYSLEYSYLLHDKLNRAEIGNFLNGAIEKSFCLNYAVTLERKLFMNKPITFVSQEISNIITRINHSDCIRLQPNEIATGIDVHQDFVNKQSLEVLGNDFSIGDGIFVISDDELQKLNLPDFEFNELIRPYYTTQELKKYHADKEHKYWLIYTDSTFKAPKSMDSFPALKNHLDKFHAVITSDNKPYGLHRARNEDFFKGEKIISLRKCTEPTFTYTDFPCYVSQTYFVIKTDRINLKYLTLLLNSKLIKFWLKYQGKMQGNNFQIDKEPLLNIPIVNISHPEWIKVFEILYSYIEYILGNNEQVLPNLKNDLLIKFIEDLVNAAIYEIYFKSEFAAHGLSILDELYKLIVSFDKNDLDSAIYNLYKTINIDHDLIRNMLKLMTIRLESILMPIIKE